MEYGSYYFSATSTYIEATVLHAPFITGLLPLPIVMLYMVPYGTESVLFKFDIATDSRGLA